MKWYENGIMFEGTPEEFRTLHPEAAGGAPKNQIAIFPSNLESQFPRTTRKKERGPAMACMAEMAEMAGGEQRHFKSAAAAYKWYAAASPVRRYRSYFQFYCALKKGEIQFADATIRKVQFDK